MRPRQFNILGLVLFFVAGCGPQNGDEFSFSLVFADLGQAQTGSGIPPDVASIRLEAYDQLGTNIVSKCISLSADSSQRESVSLDLAPGSGIRLDVQGWSDSDCGGQNPSGTPPWYGSASGLVVSDGIETEIELQVRKMGNHLNPLRDTLQIPRAFGTATYLDDGEVLVAGGFSRVASQNGTATILQASCNAEIVDVGSATIKELIPMQSCRGLQQAFKLPDGRVVLVGGSQEAIFDPTGNIRPILRPRVESLLQSVEVYDPRAKDFKLLSVQTSTMRALTAGALFPNGTVVLAGGRSSTMQTADVVSAQVMDPKPTWTVHTNGLLTERAGAGALSKGVRLLVIGGNLLNQGPDVELVLFDDSPSTAVSLDVPEPYSLALSGHAVDSIGANLFIAGGMINESGSSPSSDLLWGLLGNDELSLLVYPMVRARAYHSVGHVGCSGQEKCLAVFGGLDSNMSSQKDAELVKVNSDGQSLDDKLETGSVGTQVVDLPDGSVLVVGGLDVTADGSVSVSSAGQILTP